jgi:hypothetical protein
MGRKMDWAAAKSMGLAREETSPPRLGQTVARSEQEARSYRTTNDRPRGLQSSLRKHTTNKADARAPRRTSEGRERATNPGSYREDKAC